MPACLRPGGKIKELHENIFGLLNEKSKQKKKEKSKKKKY